MFSLDVVSNWLKLDSNIFYVCNHPNKERGVLSVAVWKHSLLPQTKDYISLLVTLQCTLRLM